MKIHDKRGDLKKPILTTIFTLLFMLMAFGGLKVDASAATEINMSELSASKDGGNYKVTRHSTTYNNKTYYYYTIELTEAGGTYELSGSMQGHVIVPVDATVILKNASITAGDASKKAVYVQASPYKSNANVATAALSIQGNATCQVLLSGANTLKGFSGSPVMYNSAGISVENTINTTTKEKHLATLIIDNADGSAEGSLTVTGGGQSAAIGGNINRATGNIEINGGNIEATAGAWATAIGDGDSDKTDNGDNKTWTCGVTCQPADITINDGNLLLYGKNAAPAIGTSDELSGDSNKGNGSGVANRVWEGLEITVNGGTTICVGGDTSLTSIGAGLYSILSAGNITINNDSGSTRLIAVSMKSAYTINNSGMTADQNSPDIAAASTANVFSFKYPVGLAASQIKLKNMMPDNQVSQDAVDFVNDSLAKLSLSGNLYGLALVLPDGSYTVGVENSTIADVVLEGGGIVYGDATNPIYTVNLTVYKDNEVWNQSGKHFALKKSGANTYLTTFAVGSGTYQIYEKVVAAGKTSYVDTKVSANVANASQTARVDYYSVNYQDPDGTTTYSEQVIMKGSKATVPANPTKAGHVFAGWDTDLSGVTINEPKIVNARWTANNYTVEFESNYPDGQSGSGTMDSQAFTCGTAQTLNENAFTLSGYTFKGWSTSKPGIYSGGAVTWDYTDQQEVQDLTTEKDGIVKLYAVWEKNIETISGSVTIEYSYYLEGDAGSFRNINLDDRAKNTVVTLRQQDADGKEIEVGRSTATFDYSNPTKEEADENGNQMLVSQKAFSFTDLPVTDSQGRSYSYYATTVQENYDVIYTDGETKLQLRMVYNPNCFDVEFAVSLDEAFANASDAQPQEVYVKIVYRDHDQAGWTKSPTAESGTIISQHGGKQALDGIYVSAQWDADTKTYSGKYPVWLYSIENDGAKVYYDYHIVVVGYKLNDDTIVVADESGFTATYEDATAETFDGQTTEWVYYTDNGASGTMKAELGLAEYEITYTLNDDSTDQATYSDAVNEYTYGIGIDNLATPERDHYTFEGWYSEAANEAGIFDENKKVTGISSTQTGNVDLYASWSPKTYDILYDVGEKGDRQQSLGPAHYVYGQGVHGLPIPDADAEDGEGYVFSGWYSEAPVDGVFNEEARVESISATQSDEVTLYARWQPITYTIVFHGNNAASDSAEMEPMAMTYDAAESVLTDNTFEATGYRFCGWAMNRPDATSADSGEDWFFANEASVSNLTTVDNGVVNMYAVWTIEGVVSINNDYSFFDDQGNRHDETADQKATGAKVVLLRRLQGEPEYSEIGNGVSTTVAFDYLPGNVATDADAYSFTEIPLADADGHLYEYRIEITLNNYDTSYGDESSVNGGFDAGLQFNPNNFTVELAVDATDLYNAGAVLPEKIYVKILYRIFDKDTMNHDDEIDAGNPEIITQHADHYITAVPRKQDGKYEYIGQFDVWKNNTADAHTTIDYDYQIVDVAYVVNDSDSAEQVIMADQADYALTGYGSWVYYDADTDAASGIMMAALTAQYNISYELYGGANPSEAPQKYSFGVGVAAADMPIPTRFGYEFSEWYSEAADDAGEFEEHHSVSFIAADAINDITLYARWIPKTYAIHYELNGGSNAADAPQQYTFGTGIAAEDMPKPERENYRFDGWYSEQSVDGVFDEDKAVTHIATNHSEDMNLYAKWVGEDYEIEYVLYGGTNAENAPTKYTYGVGITENNMPVAKRTNYVFGGWCSKDGDKISSISTTSSGKVTLYAEWTAAHYEINFDLNGGMFDDDDDVPEEYIYGEGIGSLPEPERDGYIFDGWYNEEDEKVESIFADDAGEINLTAKWTECRSEVTISISKDGAAWVEGAPTITLMDKDGQTISDLDSVLNGVYKIYADGKDTKETITVQYNGDNSGTLSYYTLTIKAQDGCEQPSGSGIYLVGEEVMIGTLETAGYYFTEWTADPDTYAAPLEQNQKISMPDYPLTLTAHGKVYTSEVLVYVKLDDALWLDKTATVSLVENRENGRTVTDLSNVPKGEYKIYVDGQDVKQLITVDHGSGEVPKATVDYYTLTLVAEDGIASVSGDGVYLKGDVAAVTAEPKTGYTFKEWTASVSGREPLTKNASVEMTEPLTLTVYAEPDGEVGYQVNHHVMNTNGSYELIRSDALTGDDGEQLVVAELKDGALEVTGGISYSHGSVDGNETESERILSDGSLVIDLYYNREQHVLVLTAGSGISSVSYGCTYYYGTQIPITAEVETDYAFTKWDADVDKFGDVILREATISMPAYDLELTAEAVLRRTEVDIDINKDDDMWKDAEVTLMNEDGEIISDLTVVPDGKYRIMINGRDSGATIEVEYGSTKSSREELDFYTLTLEAGEGIETTDGTGIYLAGTSVSIDAKVKNGYVFTGWTGVQTARTTAASATTIQMPEASLTLTANAERALSNVTIESDKDGNLWGDDAPEITLVDKDGNVITDLTAVPDGEYRIYANGVDTGKTITVEYGSTTVSFEKLSYYTLNLKAGTGVKSVSGAGVYLAGQQVTIDAVLQKNYAFVNWTGYGNEITDQTTVFTMPAEEVTLTANAELPEEEETESEDESESQTDSEAETKKGSNTTSTGRRTATVTTKETKTSGTKTGDNTMKGMFVGIMVFAAAVIVFMVMKRKRTK